MNSISSNSVSFGAIRTPFGFGTQNKIKMNVLDKIRREFNPTGLYASDYTAMFFRNRADEAVAEKYLSKSGVDYFRSHIADVCDQDTRFNWAKTGDVSILNRWFVNNGGKY